MCVYYLCSVVCDYLCSVVCVYYLCSVVCDYLCSVVCVYYLCSVVCESTCVVCLDVYCGECVTVSHKPLRHYTYFALVAGSHLK